MSKMINQTIKEVIEKMDEQIKELEEKIEKAGVNNTLEHLFNQELKRMYL